MRELALIGVAVFALLVGDARAADDDCTTAGKLAFMLGQINNQCSGYRLNERGLEAYLFVTARSVKLGGEKCMASGKVAMFEAVTRYNAAVSVAAQSGDEKRFTREICVGIVRYLDNMTDLTKAPKLYESR